MHVVVVIDADRHRRSAGREWPESKAKGRLGRDLLAGRFWGFEFNRNSLFPLAVLRQ